MAEAKQGDTVKVNYTGKLQDGTVFDTSVGSTPLEFTIGQGEIIPDFEEAVVGMNPGQSKTISAPAERAYGVHDPAMIVEVDRGVVPKDVNPQVGTQLQMRQEDGLLIPVMIAKVTDTSITLDANHPLAGEDLTFEIELVEIA